MNRGRVGIVPLRPSYTRAEIVFGTSAVAGAHDRNAEEFVYRVRERGQDPMAAMVSANSLGAEALGLQDQLDRAGLDADIIALDGDQPSSCGTAPFTLTASRSSDEAARDALLPRPARRAT